MEEAKKVKRESDRNRRITRVISGEKSDIVLKFPLSLCVYIVGIYVYLYHEIGVSTSNRDSYRS